MLETIWLLLWGLLWGIYFMLDGFDFGMAIMLPFIAKNDKEKSTIYNAIGPFWDGNEVWLVAAGGVTFAAFPAAYAVMFSSLYSTLMIILFMLILRAVSIEFRNQIANPSWKLFWDGCLAVGSFIPAFLFGVVFANIFKGIPLDDVGIFQGSSLLLFNPYGIAGGIFFVLLFLLHGSLWLAIKSEETLMERADRLSRKLSVVLIVIIPLFLLFTFFQTRLFTNYSNHPLLCIIPLTIIISFAGVFRFIGKKAWWKAWFSSSVMILGTVLFAVVGLHPYLLPSSIDTSYGMTIHNSSSSPLTLKIMLAVVLVIIPIVIVYQAWVYWLFRNPLKEEDLPHESY